MGPGTPQKSGASEAAQMDSLLPPNHPTLFMGSLQEAISYSKSSYKFLVVYFHSEMHQDTPTFVEKVFCDQTLIDLLNRNYVVWAGDVSLTGPHLASLQLQIDGFPALCIYSPSTFVPRSHMAVLNETRTQLPLQLYKLADTSNNTNLDDVLQMLTGVLEQYEGWIGAVRRTAREAAANRQLMEDQDAAYQNSLRADEARAIAEAAEEQERLAAERRAEEIERVRLQRLEEQQKLEQMRIEEEQMQAERARQELVASRELASRRLSAEPADGADAVSVTFRTVDSSRVTRRFNKTDTVELLYDFCRTLETSPAAFTLATPYPRRTFTNMQQELGELNINKAILTIEPT